MLSFRKRHSMPRSLDLNVRLVCILHKYKIVFELGVCFSSPLKTMLSFPVFARAFLKYVINFSNVQNLLSLERGEVVKEDSCYGHTFNSLM